MKKRIIKGLKFVLLFFVASIVETIKFVFVHPKESLCVGIILYLVTAVLGEPIAEILF